jgi:hypothetical protein
VKGATTTEGNDMTSEENITPDEGDVEGHVRHYPVAEENDDVEGHVRHYPVAEDEDDVEGHVRKM